MTVSICGRTKLVGMPWGALGHHGALWTPLYSLDTAFHCATFPFSLSVSAVWLARKAFYCVPLSTIQLFHIYFGWHTKRSCVLDFVALGPWHRTILCNEASSFQLAKLVKTITWPQHVLAGMSTKCSWGTRSPSYTRRGLYTGPTHTGSILHAHITRGTLVLFYKYTQNYYTAHGVYPTHTHTHTHTQTHTNT